MCVDSDIYQITSAYTEYLSLQYQKDKCKIAFKLMKLFKWNNYLLTGRHFYLFVCLCWGFTAQSTQWGHVERGQFT